MLQLPLNRRARLATRALKLKEERRERLHECEIPLSAQAFGVRGEVGVSLHFWHDLHRALGEPTCPRCPRCSGNKGVGRIDPAPVRAEVMDKWRRVLEHELELQRLRDQAGGPP